MDCNTINPLVLAYIGDAVYELLIRRKLVDKGINKVNDLQKECIKYVSAVNQAYIFDELNDKNIFNIDEIDIYKRARNAKVNSHPSNTSIIVYKKATGLEAIFGYLYLNNKLERINEIIKYIVEGIWLFVVRMLQKKH